MKMNQNQTPKPPEVKVTNEKGVKDEEKRKDGDASDSDYDEDESIFKPFTPDSFSNLLTREADEKKKDEERKNAPQEGRLVDGELKFGDADVDENEVKLVRDQALGEGSVLPESLGKPPKHLLNVPLEEIDPFIQDKSFVVITSRFKKKYIHRFSATRAFFLLSPWNPIRRFAVWLATNQFFDYFIIFTILFNCVCLAIGKNTFTETAEYVFTGIYTLEALIKLCARGLVIYKHTYLRDAWNILDIVVIVLAYTTIVLEQTSGGSSIGNVSAIRAFRVLRALKTVSIVPGLKTIISALLKSLKMLGEVILLTLFCIMVFSLFALQVYAGVLRQKCVVDIAEGVVVTPSYYSTHIKNPLNWYDVDGDYVVCGNATGSGKCPTNYTCLPDIGQDPNFGYTTFDHFGWAMLNSFQLITLDFWEDPYNKVIRANGPWNVIFFGVVVFFGSFYLINLMLAVVSMSYEEEATNTAREKEREKEKMRLKKESRKRKKRSEEEKRTQADANHLTVMSAVNGSTASSVSLKSVGNGSIGINKNHDSRLSDALNTGSKNKTLDEAKTVDEKSSKNDGKSSGPQTQDAKLKTGVKGKQGWDAGMQAKGANKSGGGISGGKDTLSVFKDKEHANPLAKISSEDSQSIASEANDGDPPKIIVKDRGWLDSDSEFGDDEDDELVDRNCECCGTCCKCYIPWLKIQNVLYKVVSDFIFEIFVTFCIVLNVIVMAIDYHGMSEQLQTVTKIANYVFTGIFIAEAILKMLALSRHYFKSAWNVFDLVIVLASIIDIGVDGIDGLSVFRGFRLLRLLRVFKLAQTWSTMRVLLQIIVGTLGSLGYLTLVLLIIIFIFAVIGMELFSGTYTVEKFGSEEDIPRWNFSEFFHALFLIFRVLCGEWIEPLWDCMRANETLCMVVFLPALVIGNFMVLNLFLAMLLNSFASDSIQRNKESKDDDKMKKGWQRLKGLFSKSAVAPEEGEAEKDKKPSIANIILALKEKKALESVDEDGDTDGKDKEGVPNGGGPPKTDESSNAKAGKNTAKDKPGNSEFSRFSSALGKKGDSTSSSKDDNKDKDADKDKDKNDDAKKEDDKAKKPKPSISLAINGKEVEEDENQDRPPGEVEDCWPMGCMKRCCPTCINVEDKPYGRRWVTFRKGVHKITEHKVFEYFILLVIFVSSIALCFEDIYLDDKPTTKEGLRILNMICVIIFIIEMFLKWIGLGFKKYFTSFWTILDFCIVVISVVSWAAESTGAGEISSFRALRTLRAFRPLRAISRWQGMRIVVNALVYAIPSIINVLLVCLIFWLIFSIAGVQLFGGRFYKCVDPNGDRANHTIVPDRATCENMTDHKWKNSDINFDHVFHGYLALFQVATFEGWIEIMIDAVDATGVDKQPYREANFQSYWFFLIFIVCGSFFTLNLFIGVIIDNFNMLKKKYEGGYIDVLLTQNQKNYYNTMKKLGSRKPQKTIKRPKNTLQKFFFDVSMSTKFEMAIVILILLNMIAMAVEHYNQSVAYTDALDIMNIIFTTIFTLEAIVKIIGMRWHYFRRAWNVFDFVIVILSIVGVVLDDILRSVFVTPSLLRVVRIFRIGRVLRLIKAAKGIRKLLFALVISLPALFNIGMLLMLIIFIYAIFGMTSFGNVKTVDNGVLDDVVNFQTFGNSMILLFRLTTAAGWNDIIEPLMVSGDYCNHTHMTMPDGRTKEVTGGDCGNSALAIIFMVSFVMITYLVIINMYIAVILENFSQAHEQEEVGITEDDFEMFYVVWERYDPHATQFIKYEHLSDFVADLDLPLGMAKPNEIALVAFDLPIYEGDRLHCLDILTSLIKHVLGGVEDSDEFRELKTQMEEKHKEAFPTRSHQKVKSTTMRRKKEDVAAKTLQRCWRKHKAQKSIRAITQMALDASLNKSQSSAANSRRPSINTVPSASPRPGSAHSTNTIRASSTAEQKRKSAAGARTLQVPTANDIKLPSDHDVHV